MLNFVRLTSIAGLVAVVHAHFQLQFPLPRGIFVENNEPNFCDGYNNAVNNRTTFPLSNGFFSLNSEHPQWSVEVLLSTVQNPTSFNDFPQNKLAVQPFKAAGEGIYCFPINLTAAAIPGVQDGANVTIQVQYNGGDGDLFQCADLTLSSTVNVSNISCTNATGSASSPNGTSTASGSSASSTSKSGAVTLSTMNYLLSLMIAVASVATVYF